MLLSGNEIQAKQFIKFDGGGVYRAASYDLTVGQIIKPDGTRVDEYLIPPHGLVKVVSSEEVNMPPNFVGYVFVKTGLCNEGLLALNIGIVDPNYSGPLRSTLVNFGKTAHRIKRGDVFSRLTIHDLPNGTHSNQVVVSREKAVEDATREVDTFLSDTFLDVEGTATKAAEKAFAGFRNLMLKWIPLAVIGIAALTFLLNFGNMYGMYHIWLPKGPLEVSAWQEGVARQLSALETSNKALVESNNKLQTEIGRLHKEISDRRLNKPRRH